MTRLLHVISDLEYGGAQTQLRLLCEAARGRGDAVAVASLVRPGPVGQQLRDAGVRVDWLEQRFRHDPFVPRRIRRLIRVWRPDAVQTWDEDSARYASVGRLPWLHTVRHAASVTSRSRRADGVLVNGAAAADACRAVGVAAEGICVASNAGDPAIKPIDAAGKRDARAALRSAGVDLSDVAPTLVVVTRLDDAAATNELVWAADLVRVVCPGLRLIVVGDGPARNACERFAAAATEPGMVVWLGPWKDHRTAINAADVVWCGRGTGAHPTPALEAMAAGKPVVLAEGPGREALMTTGSESDRPSWLVRWNDRAAWARATRRLLEDPALRTAVGAENVGIAERYALAHLVAAHSAAVRHAIESRAAVPQGS